MDAYEQVRIIGKGSFGVVTQIVRKSDRKVRIRRNIAQATEDRAHAITLYEQMLVWKEVNYGAMSEKEKQLIVSEVRARLRAEFLK